MYEATQYYTVLSGAHGVYHKTEQITKQNLKRLNGLADSIGVNIVDERTIAMLLDLETLVILLTEKTGKKNHLNALLTAVVTSFERMQLRDEIGQHHFSTIVGLDVFSHLQSYIQYMPQIYTFCRRNGELLYFPRQLSNEEIIYISNVVTTVNAATAELLNKLIDSVVQFECFNYDKSLRKMTLNNWSIYGTPELVARAKTNKRSLLGRMYGRV